MQAGTSAPSCRRPFSRCRSGRLSPHSRLSSRSAAAASAEPPPRPDATGSTCAGAARRPDSSPFERCKASAARTDEIVPGIEAAGERALDLERHVLRLFGTQLVAVLAESENRLDPVVAVGVLFAHVQRQVDLRVGGFAGQAQLRRCRLAGATIDLLLDPGNVFILGGRERCLPGIARLETPSCCVSASPRCSWISAWVGSLIAAL
jgi:hypothetical protein